MYGKNALLVDGIQQTGPYTEKLWKTGLKLVMKDSPSGVSSILVFGVGGGTVFKMFQKAFPGARLVGVDIDTEIIRIGKQYFGLDTLPHLSLVAQDARIYVKDPSSKEKYDLVIVDLYTGNGVPFFVTGKPFLAAVRRLVRPGGRMIMNYFDEKDQSRTSQILFDTLTFVYRHVERKAVLRNIFFYVIK